MTEEAQVEFLEGHFGRAVAQHFHLEAGVEVSPIRLQPHDKSSHIPQFVHFMDTLPPQACWQRGAILLVACW